MTRLPAEASEETREEETRHAKGARAISAGI